MDAIITTIKIKIGDREVELTEQEARALRAKLNELFNEAAPFTPHNPGIFEDFPNWIPVPPIWVAPNTGSPLPMPNQTWCSTRKTTT